MAFWTPIKSRIDLKESAKAEIKIFLNDLAKIGNNQLRTLDSNRQQLLEKKIELILEHLGLEYVKTTIEKENTFPPQQIKHELKKIKK